jgi:effector-binding domain-containing protein
MEKIQDTLVLTKDTTIKKTEKTSALDRLYKELQDYTNKEQLKTNFDSCRMATFYDETRDSMRITTGIPISRRISPVPDGARLMEMPPKGKNIVGRFQGSYKDMPLLYRAMRKYMFDKKLIVVGAGFEKYLSRPASPADSLNMTIELHYPVL